MISNLNSLVAPASTTRICLLCTPHSGGVNALLGDGSVRFLRDSTDLLTLARLATRDDGGVVNLDQ